jgi:hypothetical protein
MPTLSISRTSTGYILATSRSHCICVYYCKITLAYYDKKCSYDLKKFRKLFPEPKVIKLFTSVI